MSKDIELIGYVDGSTRPTNPGFSGFGIYGYTLRPSKRPNKTKHPSKAKYNFTSKGLSVTPDPEPYETINILEYIGCINSDKGTNNLAEMLGFIKLLEIATSEQELKKLHVITDSEYVVTNFNTNLQRWKSTGWVRVDGKPIVHVQEWETIDRLANQLKDSDVEITVVWVKGHSDDYGNHMADLYSVVASNHTRQQLTETTEQPFNETVLFSYIPYKDYKESLATKDIIFYFRDLFFSSSVLDDRNYCFLATSEDPTDLGKKGTASIFVTNVGYVPQLVTTVKEVFRGIPRHYITNCCIKLNRLEDKDLLRLATIVGIEKLLVKVNHHSGVRLYLIKDTSPFVMEYTYDYPYAVEASKVFNRTLESSSYLTETPVNPVDVNPPWSPVYHKADITDLFIKEGKLNFTNKDPHLDLTTYFSDHYKLTNNLFAKFGHDLPSYLALKNIEHRIRKVTAVAELLSDSNRLSLFITVELDDRQLTSVNILNKFIIRR